jgi:serine/threonine protein kinase
VLIYELVTGVRPFRGLDPQALSKTIVHGRYVSMRDLRDDVPPSLEDLVDRLLATDPVKRLGSAAEAAEELAALAASLPRVEPGGWVRQAMAGALRAERLAARVDTRPEPSTIALPMGLG